MPYLDHCVKFSNYRLIRYGDYIELYQYQKAFSYNLPPPPSNGERSYEKRRTDNLHRTQNTIRRLVYANTGGMNDTFITLTFKNEHTIKGGNREFGRFIKNLQRAIGTKLQYIAIPEFGKTRTKRLHYHCIFFKAPYIDKYLLETVWNKGYTNIKSLNGVNYIGHYISKYLSKDTYDKRLCGQKAFFCSRNLNRPHEYRDPKLIRDIIYNYKVDYNLLHDQYFESNYTGQVNYKLFKKSQ